MRIRFSSQGRRFAVAAVVPVCIGIAIVSALGLLADTGALPILFTWLCEVVCAIASSRRDLQLAGICMPLVPYLYAKRRRWFKAFLVTAVILFALVVIVAGIVHAGEAAYHAVARSMEDPVQPDETHPAPRTIVSSPQFPAERLDLSRLNPFTDIPDVATLLRRDASQRAENSNRRANQADGGDRP